MTRYDRLGDEPPTFDIATHDATYSGSGAHTDERHGPDVPLRRAEGTRTVEGRVFGDEPWARPENYSYRWTDPSTMNRSINAYIRDNWTEIRSDLAMTGRHRGASEAEHRVGEGYLNPGMHGAGPRTSQYTATSLFKIFIDILPGSDPPQPFVVTAYPAAIR